MTRSVTFSEHWLAGHPGFIAQHPYFDADGETPTYDLSDYEISADGVGDRFAAYRQRFGL